MNEGHTTIVIFRFTEFLHEILGLFLAQLLSEVGKETEQLISNHGVVINCTNFLLLKTKFLENNHLQM